MNASSVNQAPTGANNTITTLENTPYMFAASTFGFSDPNTPPNNLLAVEITTLPGAGTLSDNGVAVTAGQFVAASDISGGKLLFTPATNTSGMGYASFAFQVENNGGTANGGQNLDPLPKTMTVNVTYVNQAPTGTNNTVTTLENAPYTFAASAFGFSDPNLPSNSLLAVEITTLPGAGTLSDNGVAVTAGQFVSAADINAGKLVFTPAVDAVGAGYASFTFQVENNGGTANGGQDLDPTPKTTAVNVSYSGVPGTMAVDTTSSSATASGGASSLTFSHTVNSGNDSILVVSVGIRQTGADQQVSSITYGSQSLNFAGLAELANNEDVELWYLPAPTTGTANVVVNVSHKALFVASATDYFGVNQTIPFGTPVSATGNNPPTSVNVSSSPSQLVIDAMVTQGDSQTITPGAGQTQLWNENTGNSGGDALGGGSYEVGTSTATIAWSQQNNHNWALVALAMNASSVNQAPTGTNNTVTTLENTAYTFATTDFGFSDPNLPPNSLLAVEITTLPGAGTVTDNGVAVTAGQFVAASDISAGKLLFTPAANSSGTGYASFTFQVQNNGGTANGGVNLDPSPKTMTVNVTYVNQAPSGTNNTVTTLENTAYTFATTDFGFSDPNLPPNSLLAVAITTLPGAGTLTDNGVAVTAGQFVAASDISAGKLLFTPAANTSGTGYASFTFQVQNNGGMANGGVNLDPSPKTMTVNVTYVNQAPSGTNNTVTTLENTAYTFATTDFGFSDPNLPPNSLLAVAITTLPGAGTLTDNGVAVTAGQFVAASDISAGKLLFTPAANTSGTGYASFTFQVQNNGGTANGGVDLDPSPKTMTVNVTYVNQAPSGTNNTVTTLENTAYTFATTDFGFSDPNLPPNSLLAVEITTLPGAGTLTDNGVAVTAGQFVAASDISAGKLFFTPAANTSGTGYASFTFQVENNGGMANGGQDLDPSPKTMTVNVTYVNQAPSGTNNTVTTLENTAYTFATTDFGFSDPNLPPNSLLAVEITTLPGAGTLTDNGVAVTAGQFVAASDISAGKLLFTPAANSNGTGYASFTFQVQNNGGTANGGQDLDPSPKTMTVNVTYVNQAPSGTNNTVTTLENTAYTFATTDFGFSDPNLPPNSLLAVEITTLPGAGTLTDNGVAVTAGQFIAASDISAGKLLFTPAANSSGTGYASFTFQVQNNGGTANGGVDLDPSPKTMTVNVTYVNQAPSGTNNTVTTLENTAYTFAAADFGFSDPNLPPNSLLAVEITTLPGAGTLTDNGVAVTAGQFVAASDISAGKLLFTPATNSSGTGYASFTFQVQNNGGTANGGVDLDPSPKTMTVNVTYVNQAPSGTNNTVTTLENTAYTFATTDFGFSDPNLPPNSLLAVEITTLPGAGTLTDNGVAVTAGQFVAASDISAGKLLFTPATNSSGTGYASFTFQVQNNGGTANGGVDLDPSPKTMTVNVTYVNQAPSGTNNTVTTLENTAYTFATTDFGFSDPNLPPNSLLAVEITTLPGAGTLTDNGVAVTAGQFVAASDISAGKLFFTPAANTSGTGYASFTFQVENNGGMANGGVNLDPSPKTMTVNVTPVDQAPLVTVPGPQSSQPIGIIFSMSTGNAVTISDASVGNAAIQVTLTATNGAITLAGTRGLTLSLGSGQQDARIVMTGTVADVNAAMNGMLFRPTAQSAQLQVVANDLGNGGTGGPKTGSGTVVITQVLVPFPPSPPIVIPPAPAPAPFVPGRPLVPPIPVVVPDVPPVSPTPPPAAPTKPTVRIASNVSQPQNLVQAWSEEMPLSPTAGSKHRAQQSAAMAKPPAVSPELSCVDAGSALWTDLDAMDQKLMSHVTTHDLAVGAALAVSTGFTVGYVLWMLRGGMLLTSLLAQMPAWRLVDPLVVLSHTKIFENDGEQETLGTIVDSLEDRPLEPAVEKEIRE